MNVAKKIILWLVLLVPDTAMSVAAFPLAPLIAAFSERRARRWFPWFMTPDNPMTGDAGHEARTAGRSVYYKKVTWMWRNRAYGFSATVTRALTAGPVRLRTNVDGRVTDSPVLVAGCEIRTTPEGYWQLYWIRRSFKGKCLRVNLGWKLWDAVDAPLFGQYVISVNPFIGAP